MSAEDIAAKFTLQDKFSDKAEKIAGATKKVRTEAELLAKAEKEQARAAKVAERDANRKIAQAKKAADAAIKEEKKKAAASAASDKRLSAGAYMLARDVFAMGASFAHSLVQAIDFNLILEKQVGLYADSSAGAKRMADAIRANAAYTGQSTDQFAAWSNYLSELGMKGAELQKVTMMMADLSAMGKNAQGVLAAAGQIRKIQLEGRQTITGANMVAMFEGLGLDQTRLERALGLKGNRFEIQQKLANTQYKLNDVMNAFGLAVQDATHASLGKFAAESAGSTIQSKLNILWEQFSSAVAKADLKPFMDSIDGVIKTIGKKETIQSIGDGFNQVARILPTLGNALENLVDWLIDVGFVHGKRTYGAAESRAIIPEIDIKTGEQISRTQTAAEKESRRVGIEMANGMASGFSMGVGAALVPAIKDGLNTGKAAAKDHEQIRSPSRRWANEVGTHISGGIALGIRQGGSKIDASLGDILPTPTSGPGGTFGGVGGGRSVNVNVEKITLEVSGAASPREVVDLAAEHIVTALERAIAEG